MGTLQTTGTLDPDLKAIHMGNVDYARQVANQLGQRQFAGFDPLYQQGEAMAQQVAGGAGSQNLGLSGDLIRAVAGYTPQQVGTSFSPQQVAAERVNYNYSPEQVAARNVSQQYAAERIGADPSAIQAYQDPYTQQVIDPALADLERTRQQQMNQLGASATQAGAFGGSRHGVAEAQTNIGFGRHAGQLAAGLRSQGFQHAAQQAMQQNLANQQTGMTALQMGQRGELANQQTGLQANLAKQQAGLQNAQLGLQANLANQQTGLQAARVNQQAGLQAAQLEQTGALANQQAGLQGAQFRLGAAGQLGNVAQAQQQMGLRGAGALQNLGLSRQQLEQQQLDAARGLGQERLGIMQSAAGQIPVTQTQTQTKDNDALDYLTAGATVLGGLSNIGFNPFD